MTLPNKKTTRKNKDESEAITVPALIPVIDAEVYALPFVHYLTIPKFTLPVNYTSYTLKLPHGVIEKIWLEFPRGCSGLVGVQIWRNPRQIFPMPYDVWMKSDNIVLPLPFVHEIITEPFEVELRGYNMDDTYSHTIGFIIEMSGKRAGLSPELKALFEYIG